MRTENTYAVARALGRNPSTIDELQGRTGLSYSTVKRGLREAGAVKVEGSWPVRWTKPAKAVSVGAPVNVTGSLAETDQTVLVDLVRADDLLARWQGRQEAFAAELRLLVMQPDSDPKQLSAALAHGASALASIALAIREHEDRPDWFTILGGLLDNFENEMVS